MALTKMGAAKPAANTLTTLYTVPALKSSAASLMICNSNTHTAVSVFVALSALATPADGEYVAEGMVIPASETVILPIVITAAELVVVKASLTGVTFRLHGDLV